jgi:hypothetical protein
MQPHPRKNKTTIKPILGLMLMPKEADSHVGIYIPAAHETLRVSSAVAHNNGRKTIGKMKPVTCNL